MVDRLAGITGSFRRELREQVLGATMEDFRRFGDALERVAVAGRVVVLGSPDAVEEARAERDDIEVTPLL